MSRRNLSAGVTLIELSITIALVGIVAALIVNFVQPVRSYIDTSRRAALADTADTALRRIGRDVRLALPNSVRVDGTGKYVEFLLVRTGGRYRFDTDPAATNTCTGGFASDVLSFNAADTCFKTIGNVLNLSAVTTSDFLVVFNLQPGTTNADAYASGGVTGGNKSKIDSLTPPVSFAGEDRITIESHQFTFESPGRRFFIIEGPVTYGCSGGNLTRYSGYTISAAQVAPPGGASAVLASGVADCSFTYDSSGAAQGSGLLTMSLRLSMQDSRGDTENVNLYHAVHVNNVP